MRVREQVILIEQCKTNFLNQNDILKRLEEIANYKYTGIKEEKKMS